MSSAGRRALESDIRIGPVAKESDQVICSNMDRDVHLRVTVNFRSLCDRWHSWKHLLTETMRIKLYLLGNEREALNTEGVQNLSFSFPETMH